LIKKGKKKGLSSLKNVIHQQVFVQLKIINNNIGFSFFNKEASQTTNIGSHVKKCNYGFGWIFPISKSGIKQNPKKKKKKPWC
jgi:hypothetical protein